MVDGVMSSFVREMIGGVSNVLLNNPMLSWENGFIKIIAAICALIAISNIIMSLNNQQAFAEKSLRFLFMLIILFMNFGVINPRSFFPFQLGDYEYINKSTVDSSVSQFLTTTLMKPKPTLDRDIYNTLAKTFDDLASSIASIAGNEQTSVNENGETVKEDKLDLQTQAIYNTLFFLSQIKVAKLACNNNGNTVQYVDCLKKYVPYEAELSPNGGQSVPKCANGQPCGIEGGAQLQQGQAAGNDGGGSSYVDILTSGGMGLGKLVTMFMASFTYLYMIVTDFAFIVGLPLILWLVELVRNIVTLYFVIRYGFQASLLLVFAKIMSPLILIESKWNDVKSAYMLVFSTALFGFMSQLFVMAATILSIGLHSATYNVIAPKIYAAGSGVGDAVQLTAQINGLVYLVYFAIFVIMILQILAMTKIDKACEAFLNFSATGFVNLGKELVGSAINVGLAAGAMVAAAPMAMGAMTAGAAAKGGLSLATTAGRQAFANNVKGFGSKMTQGAGRAMNLAKDSISDPRGTMRDGLRSSMNSISTGADYMFGDEVGAKARQMFGPGGATKKSPGSVIAAPEKTGAGREELENPDSTPSSSGDSSGAGTATAKAALSGKKTGTRSGRINNTTGNSGGAGRGETSAQESDGNPFNDVVSKAERRASNYPFDGKRKTPKLFEHPAMRAALMAGNAVNAVQNVVDKGSINTIGDAMSGFNNGMGANLTKNLENTSGRVSQLLDTAYLNDGFRERVANFNRSIDNVDEDVKAESAINLKSAVEANIVERTLDEESSDINVLKDVSAFKALESKISENAQLSSEEKVQLAKLSTKYNLSEPQSIKLNKYAESDLDYKKLLSERKAAEQQKISTYLKNSNADNSNALSSAIMSGDISRDALTNPNLSSKISQVQQQNVSSFSNKLAEIDVSKLGDESYTSQSEVKRTMNQAERFGGNRAMQMALMNGATDSKSIARTLSSLQTLDSNYADSLSSMSSNQELREIVATFPDTIASFSSKKIEAGQGFIARSSTGEMNYIVGKTRNDQVTSISISDIKNQDIRELLIKQNKALIILKKNPELAEQYGAKFEDMATILDFIKF